jgi:MHS family proline/betaine transporter-like MFS transporter
VPAAATPTTCPITRTQIRTVAGATIGAVLEWFDLLVYAMFAVVLAKQFFPTTDPSVSLLLSLGTFALAWLVRPVGAVVIGAYADRAGRKPALILSAGLMMIGTLLTGALPPYSAIGIALLAEQDPARRGFYASLQWSASGLAVFLAAASAFAINSLLTPDQVAAWGWRIPFLFGLLIGPAAWYIRSRGEETPEFLETTMATNPVAEIAGQDKLRVLLGAGVVAAGAAGSYTINYMPTFAATQLHMGPTTALIGTMVAGVVNTIFPPLFGHLSDRYGRFTVMGLFGALGLLLIYPLFLWVLASPTLATLILIQVIVALVFYCGYYATVPAFLAELFPTRRRTTVSLRCGPPARIFAFGLSQRLYGLAG